MAQDVCIFFLQEVLMTVDAAMVINIFSGLPGMRNMGLAKQPHRPSNPVLPYPNLIYLAATFPAQAPLPRAENSAVIRRV